MKGLGSFIKREGENAKNRRQSQKIILVIGLSFAKRIKYSISITILDIQEFYAKCTYP